MGREARAERGALAELAERLEPRRDGGFRNGVAPARPGEVARGVVHEVAEVRLLVQAPRVFGDQEQRTAECRQGLGVTERGSSGDPFLPLPAERAKSGHLERIGSDAMDPRVADLRRTTGSASPVSAVRRKRVQRGGDDGRAGELAAQLIEAVEMPRPVAARSCRPCGRRRGRQPGRDASGDP